MQVALNWLNYLFRSTNGLVLVAMSITAVVTVIWGTLSGPAAEWGIKDFMVGLLGFDLKPLERVGRLVVLYHTIAMAVIAIEVYFITAIVPMKPHQRTTINATVTVGYLCTMIFGLWFGYFGHNFLWHGIYLFGLSLMFFSGILLAVALNPWNKEYNVKDKEYAHTPKGTDLERVAFFTMTVATLGSALFGAAAGAFLGNGFEVFLAEDLIRIPNKSPLQLSVVGHLHIMVALVGVAITLIIGRWLDFKGIFHKIAMPFMIFGSIVLTLGVWLVVPFQPIAHIIIYVGSTFVMLAALMLVIFGWRKLIRDRLEELNIRKAGFFKGLRALLHDPLKFGPLWQMVFMNFNVSGIGLFMAAKLDEIIRVWPARDERVTLTGHWHILSTIIASIILMYYADRVGLKGRVRQWFGWVLIIGTDIAFAAATLFSTKRLGVSEFGQQSFVDVLMVLMDIGLGATLTILFLFLLWRFVEMLKKNGSWKKDLDTIQQQVKRYTSPLLLVILVALFGCSEDVHKKTSIDVPFIDTGVDADAWALVPAGEFYKGPHLHVTPVDHDYEIMVTNVTHQQYADYLNEALAAGSIKMEGDEVKGTYPGDKFDHYNHEIEIKAGDKLHLKLNEPGLRIKFDGSKFTVQSGFENHPVVMMTWFGAKAYCDFYGWRLPTESEWEKAARGTDERAYPWGDEISRDQANFYSSRDPFENIFGKQGGSTPVGYYNGKNYDGYQTLEGKSPYGLYDMAGNVWQWTGDDYPYMHYRWMRGGSNANYEYDVCVWSRNSAGPDHYSVNVGFRCARDARAKKD